MRRPLSLLLLLASSLVFACGDDGSFEPSNPSSPPSSADAGVSTAGDAGTASSGDAATVSPGDAATVSADAGAVSADAGPADSGAEPEVLTHPFVRASHDPFSTFAADVDSASYDIFAKSVREEGRLPEREMVRTEEFVNFFAYDYPSPSTTSTAPFAIDLDIGASPTSSTAILRIAVQGRDLLADRAPASLVFLVDVSCSMGRADKLPLVRGMLTDALDVLDEEDTVSIVTYSTQVAVALAPTPVRNRSQIVAVLERLSAGGSTAGGPALQRAYDQASAGFVEEGINHIVLCTDGDFNLGLSTTPELLDLVERERATGVTLTALGFGLGNLNDELMEAISNAGNGIYRFISGPKTAFRYVEQRMLSDVVHIAQDVKIQVEMNPDFVYAYRQIGYENRQLSDSDFRDDRVDAGEIGSGHQMTALYELVLTPEALPRVDGALPLVDGAPVEGPREVDPGAWVLVKIRSKTPGAAAADPASELQTSLMDGNLVFELGAESRFAWAVASLAARLRGDPYVTSTQLDVAQQIANIQPPSVQRTDFADLFALARSLLP